MYIFILLALHTWLVQGSLKSQMIIFSFTMHLDIITSLFLQQNAQLYLWILFFGGLFILPAEHFYILLAKNYCCLPVHSSHIYIYIYIYIYTHTHTHTCPFNLFCNQVTSWNPNGTKSKGRPHVMNKSVSKCELSRYIKLSSPRLNNMAVVGCILVYMAVILLGLDHATLPTNTHFSAVCTVSTSMCNQSSKYMMQGIPILVNKFPTLLILKIQFLLRKAY